MIEIDRDLRDIVISALRYAIGRRTYVTWATCDFIMKNSRMIDKHMKDVMLNDLKNIEDYYDKDDCDYKMFIKFKEWLEDLEC